MSQYLYHCVALEGILILMLSVALQINKPLGTLRFARRHNSKTSTSNKGLELVRGNPVSRCLFHLKTWNQLTLRSDLNVRRTKENGDWKCGKENVSNKNNLFFHCFFFTAWLRIILYYVISIILKEFGLLVKWIRGMI